MVLFLPIPEGSFSPLPQRCEGQDSFLISSTLPISLLHCLLSVTPFMHSILSSAPSPNIAQRITSATPGAIGVIALYGPSALIWIRDHFRSLSGKTLLDWSAATVRFGQWKLTDQHAEELVIVCKDEKHFELHCHAGLVVQSILTQLASLGADVREPVVSAETYAHFSLEDQAKQLLLRATSETTAAILLDQNRGALRRELQEAVALLEHGAVQVAMAHMQELLQRSSIGLHLVEPWQVQLAGPPNVGKSSLLNSILGYQRAIVHDSAGTTRDLVHASTSLNGWPFRFTDSAGIREEANLAEAEALGIERALAAAQTMDLIVLVLEPAHGLTATHEMFLQRFASKTLMVLNQIDRLSPKEQTALCEQWNALGVSAHTGEGLESLLAVIQQRLIPGALQPNQGLPFLPQHAQVLTSALHSAQNGQIPESMAAIHELLKPR